MVTGGGLPVIDPKIQDDAWRKDEQRGLWIGPNDRGE